MHCCFRVDRHARVISSKKDNKLSKQWETVLGFDKTFSPVFEKGYFILHFPFTEMVSNDVTALANNGWKVKIDNAWFSHTLTGQHWTGDFFLYSYIYQRFSNSCEGESPFFHFFPLLVDTWGRFIFLHRCCMKGTCLIAPKVTILVKLNHQYTVNFWCTKSWGPPYLTWNTDLNATLAQIFSVTWFINALSNKLNNSRVGTNNTYMKRNEKKIASLLFSPTWMRAR